MTLSKIHLSVKMTQRQNGKEKPGRSLACLLALRLLFADVFKPKVVVGFDEFAHDLDEPRVV
jgi:hypothetical protein